MYTFKLIAFTDTLDKAEQDTISRVLKTMLKGHSSRLFNIQNYKLEDFIKDYTVLIVFGKRLYDEAISIMQSQHLDCFKLVRLPHPRQLLPIQQNKITRNDAYIKMKELQEFLDQDILVPNITSIDQQDLPDLSLQQMIHLLDLVRRHNKDRCYQTSINGKLVEISEQPIDNSKADISITFEELFTIQAIMNLLQTKKVEVIPQLKNEGQNDTEKQKQTKKDK